MKTRLLVLSLTLFLPAAGCMLFIPQETLYLESAQDRATQEDVRQRLGAPTKALTSQAGEPVWVYHIRVEDPGTRWSWTGMWCDEYVLTFDKQAVLRHWTHKSEFHAGERMPQYCVPGGYPANW